MKLIDRLFKSSKPIPKLTVEEVFEELQVLHQKSKDRDLYYNEIAEYTNTKVAMNKDELVIHGRCLYFINKFRKNRNQYN